ncbi:MAG: DUF2344 domain-containing protein [Coriobacteriaceae bacterium]|nr:DUF2344 domain-containing protein [Coriobacteriaceae bacterium]
MTPSSPAQPLEQTLFRLRVRYAKRGRLAYLGHLEVIHTIDRAIRRAGLPFAVTQGFSPHMRVGFSSALPVGTSSSCEWFDLFLTELVPAPEALERLKRATAADLAPDQAGYVEVRRLALTAEIGRIGYRVELLAAPGVAADAPAISSALEEVRAAGAIPYRRGKKEKVLDLDRSLAAAAVAQAGAAVVLDLDTRADNDGSLRPEILIAALDRSLRGSDEPIVSTGIQDLAAFERYRVERTFQGIEDDAGALTDPLGAPGPTCGEVVIAS